MTIGKETLIKVRHKPGIAHPLRKNFLRASPFPILSAETKMDQDLRFINTINPIESLVDNLRRDCPDLSITEEMLLGRYQTSPLLPILFVITRRKNARDWFTGTILSSTNVGPEHQLELHHIFPKAVLKDSKKYDDDEINDIANIAFLSHKANRKILKSQPDEYLKDIETERLEAQFVPTDRNLWKVDKFRDCLSTRRKMLRGSQRVYERNRGAVLEESISKGTNWFFYVAD